MFKMENGVVSINKLGKVVYESIHKTAESAYEEYVKNIAIAKKCCNKGDEITIARVRYGQIMTMETVRG